MSTVTDVIKRGYIPYPKPVRAPVPVPEKGELKQPKPVLRPVPA